MRVAIFVAVWLVFGMVFVILEYGLLGDSAIYPSTKNEYNFENSLLLVPFGSLVMGFLQGWMETMVFDQLLKRRALWIKISLKAILYIGLTMLFLIVLAMFNQFLNSTDGTQLVGLKLTSGRFIGSMAYWSIVMYAGLGMTVAIIISEFSNYLGIEQFFKFLKGEYNLPNEEERIFLFMDMKGSTAIAEQLGHVRYFELIRRAYEVMTDAILSHEGEIYQYVGDEVVLTWSVKSAKSFDQCLRCFEDITQSLANEKQTFLEEFGIEPQFKAGAHVGIVTSGEIGVLKRDIVYTGDVLNTASRIQGKCNELSCSLLVSEAFRNESTFSNDLFTPVGAISLRGKQDAVGLFSINS